MALSLNKEHFHGHGHGHGHGHLSDTPMYARTHIHRVPNHLNEFCNHPVCRFPIPQTLALEGIKDLVFQGPQGFYYQPLKEGQLRLLVLLPSSFPQAPVRCRLISAIICELTDRFRYERVSGVSTISLDDSFQEAPDGEDPTTIQLNATQVRVSKKLESALKEFRDKSAELTFWVESKYCCEDSCQYERVSEISPLQ